MQKRSGWTKMTTIEKQKIIDMYTSGKFKYQKDIARAANRDASIVCTIIKEYNLNQSRKPVPKATATTKTVEKPAPVKPVSKKKYSLSEKEKNLNADTISLLQTAKSHNEFVQGYYKNPKLGFEATVFELINMWTHRDAILEHEKEKHVVKLPQKQIVEKADADVGSYPSLESLQSNNNRMLAECIQLHKEILAVLTKQFDFFKQEQARVMAEKSGKHN
jgi:hypothetical protein